MGRTQKTKEQLLQEITDLRAQLVRLENTQSEQVLRQFAENVPGMVYKANKDWSAVIIAGCEQICGYTANEMNAKPEKWLSLIHPDDKEKVLKRGVELTAKPDSVVQTYRIQHKDGNIRWVEDRKASRFTKEGKFVAIDGVLFDITERKQAEEALKESEEKFRLQVTNSPSVLWTTDSTGTTIYISPNVEQIYGFTPEELYNDKESKHWLERIHPNDAEKFKTFYAKLFSEDAPYDVEFRISRKDGQWIWLHDRATVHYEKDGLQYAYGVFSDVTERKQAEKALRESEEKYKSLFESAGDALFIMDITEEHGTRFVDCNERTLKLFGCTHRDQIIGKNPEDFSPAVQPDGKSSREKVFELVNAIIEGHPQIFEWMHYRLDGTPFWVEVNLARIELKGKNYLQAIVRDITERKLTELALRESEEKFRSLVTNIPSVLWTTDSTGVTVYVSPNVEQVLGFTPEGIYKDKRSKLWFARIHTEDVENVKACYAKLFNENTPYDIEYRIKRKDGKWIWVHSRAMIHCEKEGLQYAYGVFSDITERKQAEEALRYQLNFENLVTEISTNFINLPADQTDHGINQALKVLGEFAGVDRTYVFRVSEDARELTNTHEWCAKGIKSEIDDLQHVSFDTVPWWIKELRKLQVIHVPSVKSLPPEALGEKRIFEEELIKSLIAVPMVYDDRLIGFVGFDSVRTEKTWGEKSITLLRIIAEIFVNTIMRHKTQQELEDYHHKMFRAEQLASLGTISATIAHELNQPLTVIRLLLQQSCRVLGRKKPDIDKTVENLNDCLAEISKTVTTVDRFRQFAIKSSPVDVRKVDLAETARAIVSVLRRTAKQAKLTLSLKIDKSPLFIRGNIVEFEQIFFVLIQNAIQTADAKKTRKLEIALFSANGQILLKFADTCGGVDPENEDRIFEPFFTTKSREVGTGLGLCILERIVKRYDGSLRFENRPGHGITFYITLPVKR